MSSASSVHPPAGLVVVTIDRLPAWMLSAWGATWVSTPVFDGLAARGITFDRLIATDADPLATLAALAGDADTRGAGELLNVAAAAGWPAVLLTDDARLPERTPGVELVEVLATPAVQPAADEAATNLGRLFARAGAVVTAGRHRLVWCHAGSLGVAWDAPPAYREAYVDPEDPPPPSGAGVPHFPVTAETDPDLVMGCRQAFAGQLSLLDRCLGGLVDAVRGLGPAWGLAVIGLRGMPLGLHGAVGCSLPDDATARPYGEWVHLPAVIVAAHGGHERMERMAGQRYGGLVTPADIGATLIDLTFGRRPPGRDGGDARSLAGLFTDWSHEPRDRVLVRAGAGRAVVTRGWHLVAEPATDTTAPPPRLYVKPDDFFELSDVADRCPDVAEELAGLLAPGAAERPLSAHAIGS
ncbi:MAG: hypothetical protein EBS56_06790 [Planctomycetia bacterium]|nr:hypothetical protein [Planctomycetia bacterium]